MSRPYLLEDEGKMQKVGGRIEKKKKQQQSDEIVDCGNWGQTDKGEMLLIIYCLLTNYRGKEIAIQHNLIW